MVNIGMEQQVQIRAADGSILWTGTAVVAASYIVTSSEASAAFVMAEGVVFDPAAAKGIIPRLVTQAAGAAADVDLPQLLVLMGKRIAAAADVGFIGVAIEPIKVGGKGLVAGPGSLVPVITTSTTIAVGACVGGSATAGSAALVAKGTAGLTLGVCIKTNTGTPAAPGAGMGSTTMAGIMVAPA